MERVFNFGAGPAMLPTPVMEEIQAEFLDYQEMGASLIEISHRSPEFKALLEETNILLRELMGLPAEYQVLYMHGGARMQFAAIPMNLLGRVETPKALYVESGTFSKVAIEEAKRYGQIEIVASSAETQYDRIPELDVTALDPNAAYLHITSNNTIYGTRWHQYPELNGTPLIVDATSDLLSRVIDYSKLGMIYAGLQKNLGPSGVAVVILREDLMGKAFAQTPSLLDYEHTFKNQSLSNTANTFAIYVMNRVLHWLKAEGGVAVMEEKNQQKAKLLYDYLDQSSFYQAHAHPEHRSIMNVTFQLPNDDLLERFLKQALQEKLYALKGHRQLGGVRASIYNAMPREGVEALVAFMKHFEDKG